MSHAFSTTRTESIPERALAPSLLTNSMHQFDEASCPLWWKNKINIITESCRTASSGLLAKKSSRMDFCNKKTSMRFTVQEGYLQSQCPLNICHFLRRLALLRIPRLPFWEIVQRPEYPH